MSQASVLSDADIRRVFRVIETTRYAERNRIAFVLSIYAGMRVGEIAALKVSDVINRYGEVRSEIKLAADQTKGGKGRTVILSRRSAGKMFAECLGERRSVRPAHCRSNIPRSSPGTISCATDNVRFCDCLQRGIAR